MSSFLQISIRLLDPQFHGRGEDGEPEWPPSPLRAFQALVAAAAARWNQRLRVEYAAPALRWLESQPAPTIVAAVGVPADAKFRLYVPDNVADKVARSWRGGNAAASIADYRTEKDVRPTHLRGGDAVHYLYPLPNNGCPYLDVLSAAARSVTHLGWGVDMVAGNAAVISDEDAAKLPGERWQPDPGASANGLRVPRDGTLADLAAKHAAFLNRLSGDGFRPVPPLTAFRVVGYRRATDPAGREWVAFELLKPEATGKASFDTARRCRDVAAWVRNVTGAVCGGWSDLASFVHGHDPADGAKPLKGDGADARFMYLPLPTINHKLNRVESIRRVLVAAPAGFREKVECVRRRLAGQDLIDERSQEVVGVLNLLPQSDWVLRQYVGESAVWSTVTPVILPGHDDGAAAKAERLLVRAFAQAGLPEPVELEWRRVGYRAGLEPADRYTVPDQLSTYPRYHARVRLPGPIRGPVALGAGRYRGFGVFAAERG